MTNVYKFDNYSVYGISPKVLTIKPVGALEQVFNFGYYRSQNNTLVPVPKNINIDGDKDKSININKLINGTIEFEDKVYIHPNCSIPRAKVTQKYTKVLRASNADVCVVPKADRTFEVNTVALFINKIKGKIYYINPEQTWDKGKYVTWGIEACDNQPLNTAITQINPDLINSYIKEHKFYADPTLCTNENWEDFLNSTLIYYGPYISVSPKELYVAALLYNKLHNVVTEDTVLATLGDKENELTEESYDNISQMLRSMDDTVVGLGLKALAELDYKKYRNTVKFLLCNTSSKWTRNKMKQSTSVKYMLNYLNLWGHTHENYTQDTSIEDFNMMKKAIIKAFDAKINHVKESFKYRFPFAVIDFSYNFDVNPILEN